VCSSDDAPHNRVYIIIDRTGRNAQGSNAERSQRAVAHAIILHPCCVRGTIDLNCKPRLCAIEIRDEPADHLLAAKVQPDRVASQHLPEDTFAASHLAPECSCDLQLDWTHSLSVGDLHSVKHLGDEGRWSNRGFLDLSPGPSPFWRGEPETAHPLHFPFPTWEGGQGVRSAPPKRDGFHVPWIGLAHREKTVSASAASASRCSSASATIAAASAPAAFASSANSRAIARTDAPVASRWNRNP
jgi:hypothetical protein